MNETIFNYVPGVLGVLPEGTLNNPVLENNVLENNSQIFDTNLTSYVSGAGNDANNFNSDTKISLVDTSGNLYDFTAKDVISKIIFRTINGRYNNLRNPDWGATETQLLRLTYPDYADGISEPRGGFNSILPSAREISSTVAAQYESIPNSTGLSDWFWQWGQFIDHDMDLTESADPLEPFNIVVPTGDSWFDPMKTGTKTINLNRSIFDPNTGTGTDNPRQQINLITAYLDASMVYGSDEATANALRTNDGRGQLSMSIGYNGEALLPVDSKGFFLAGDIRVNEQVGLTSTHTLFVREHNRLANEIAHKLETGNNKILDLFNKLHLNRGDFIYESARRITGAEIQAITYNEFLPLLVGADAIPDYKGYNPWVNPSISNEFSTAAFRVGHTMLSPQLLRVDGPGKPGKVEEIALQDAFFDPDEIYNNGIDSLLRGLSYQKAQEIDNKLVDDVRNLLFGPPGAGGFDLASLNIQRGRDHGLPDFNTVRVQMGLPEYSDFDEFTGGNHTLSKQLAEVYGSVDNVDLWVGGLAESHAPGAVVGETFQKIIADQFTRLRDGDRFWYGSDPYLKPFEDLIDINYTLSEVIKDNSSVTDIHKNAFLVPHAVDATVI